MSLNYSAWNIHPNDFPTLSGKVQNAFLAQFGILAPSSHNSQPWRFSIGDFGIDIEIEPTRTIPVGDPEDRFSRVSIGCAVANIVAAASHYHLIADTEYHPDRVRLTFSKNTAAEKEDLLNAVLSRVTNRTAYGDESDAELMAYVRSPSDPDLEVHIATAQAMRDEIAEIAVDASIAAMEDSDFREELSRHVKSNLTKAKTGIPAFGLGMPTPPSLLASFLVKRINMSKATRAKDYEIFRTTPAWCLIAAQPDSPQAQIRTGHRYEEIALHAHTRGFRTAAWGAPIIVEGFYQRLAHTFGTNARPQLLFRLGKPLGKDPPHSPRIPLEEIVRYTEA